MAFTGSATIKKVAENLYRITGLSLAADAAGTIGLAGGSGDVELPETDDWQPYGDVTLIDAIQCYVIPAGDQPATAVPVRVTKAGATNDTFLITLTSDDGAAASGALEIYVRFH
jgi:hypothetical protein